MAVHESTTVTSTATGRRAPYYARTPCNYPQAHWWIAATSAELGAQGLLARRILDRPVVLFRTADGSAAALEDRCPHRGTPLSLGRLEGDELVCGYHGMRFTPDGRCRRVPTQEAIPNSACVRAFAVVERPPFVWIWTGSQGNANADEVPIHPWLNDAAWVHALGYFHINANYMMLKENVLDLSHFAFVHASTFAMDDDYGAPPQCTVEDGRVTFRQAFLDTPLPPFYGDHCGLGRKPVDRYDEGASLSPAEHVFTARIANRDPAPGERDEYYVKFQHMTTPETPSTHHYWWVMARDHGLGPQGEAWMKTVIEAGFAEDKVILESIQHNINANAFPDEAAEFSVVADRAGLQARRQAQALIEREEQQ